MQRRKRGPNRFWLSSRKPIRLKTKYTKIEKPRDGKTLFHKSPNSKTFSPPKQTKIENRKESTKRKTETQKRDKKE